VGSSSVHHAHFRDAFALGGGHDVGDNAVGGFTVGLDVDLGGRRLARFGGEAALELVALNGRAVPADGAVERDRNRDGIGSTSITSMSGVVLISDTGSPSRAAPTFMAIATSRVDASRPCGAGRCITYVIRLEMRGKRFRFRQVQLSRWP
jgi:hypothetical protein